MGLLHDHNSASMESCVSPQGFTQQLVAIESSLEGTALLLIGVPIQWHVSFSMRVSGSEQITSKIHSDSWGRAIHVHGATSKHSDSNSDKRAFRLPTIRKGTPVRTRNASLLLAGSLHQNSAAPLCHPFSNSESTKGRQGYNWLEECGRSQGITYVIFLSIHVISMATGEAPAEVATVETPEIVKAVQEAVRLLLLLLLLFSN